ncbi:MAG: HD domain-containing protein [Bryobacteraceae bacterium]|nr:HD domain-containing protein [Bryobacteraceae bacterium]
MHPGWQKLEDALVFATRLHAGQFRKGTAVPYISHLLAVASLALEHGADEEEAIAALLHDAVEDQGGAATRAEIQDCFGGRVAFIVDGCSDCEGTPKPPWRERKERYIAHVRTAHPSIRLVSACDKLHNARALLVDYRSIGDRIFERFNGGKQGTLWYYRSLVEAYREAGTSILIEELDRVVSELENLTSQAAHA